MKYLFVLLAACGSSGSSVDAAPDGPPGVGVLFVNEVMPSNTTACADPFGEYDDWIELYNSSSADLDLTGYYVSDDPTQPMREQLQAGVTVPAGGFKLLWADEQVQGVDHLQFKLEAKGESFLISAPDGTLIDTITFGAATTDVSFARLPDGTGAFADCPHSTCGASNGTSCGS
ncbi:MAG: lamin tail domain-containing protein [Kofleriaceae bacterium]